MNILFTSAGRRGYLVSFFRDMEYEKNKLFVANSEVCAAMASGDERVITPLIYSDNYIPFLISYCKEKSIDMIISLFDIDLLILARHRKEFEDIGVTVMVSDERVIEICNDKWRTYLFAKENNINVPRTFISLEDIQDAIRRKEVQYPVIIKPRWGMGSIGVYEAQNDDELRVLTAICRRKIVNSYLKYESRADIESSVLFQEKIEGQEYGVDVINDFDCNYKNAIVKCKLAMRSGETDIAVVEKNNNVESFAKEVSGALRHKGNLDMDVFVSDEKVFLLEMNARFGGGYPFSHLAGVDLPTAYVKWSRGDLLQEELSVKEYGRIIQKGIGFVELCL